jgi:3-deoxy-7-phosphoheptulonate synthase
MVVVMAADATGEDADNVVSLVREAGGEAFVSRGVSRTIIGLSGDIDTFATLNLPAQPGVEDVVRISVPYKLVSREHRRERSVIKVAGVPIGPDTLTVIAGPCAVETPQQTLESALMAKAAGASLLRGGAYKPRSSPYAFQGLGEKGLRILADVRAETGLPIVTEVVDPSDVDLVTQYADMLQVGTRNMQNFPLLQAVGGAGKPVMLKRGMSATIEEWLMAAEYIAQRGNLDIVLCERGIRTFETATRNTLDISAVPVAQRLSHLPVIVDPSHSGGRRDLVLPLSRAAIAVGADGIIVDVHPHPETALCDGPQALVESDLRELASVALHLSPLVGRTLTPAPRPVPRSPSPAPSPASSPSPEPAPAAPAAPAMALPASPAGTPGRSRRAARPVRRPPAAPRCGADHRSARGSPPGEG